MPPKKAAPKSKAAPTKDEEEKPTRGRRSAKAKTPSPSPPKVQDKKGKKQTKADEKKDQVTKDADPAPKRGRGKGKEEAPKDDAPAKAPRGGKGKVPQDDAPSPKKQVKKDKSPSPAKEQNLTKTIVKGRAPVDEYVPQKEKYHVLEYNGVVYDCMMNQTNIIGGNNNNKFYICQVLETDATPHQYLQFNRWGRVGVPGATAPQPGTRESCIAAYNKKVREKSVSGDYRILERDFTPAADPVVAEKKEKDAFSQSKLPLPVKDLVKTIFDLKMMNRQMMEIGYDAKKMPLGKLAKSTIQKGFKVLEQISQAIKSKASESVFQELTSEFYSQIPHDFGFSKAPIIKTDKAVKEKLEMLESIQQIQVATKILEDASSEDTNLIDNHYAKLEAKLTPHGPGSEVRNMVEQYVKNTHAKTHNQYSLQVLEVFEVDKDLDKKRFKADIGNRMLLWHGSRITNFVGILSQGLRIAPPEAPVTGYMFGKGVYFADMVSKSANYCGVTRENNVGLLLLCEVALGEMNPKYYADYNANNLPPGKSSTMGCGKTGPDPKQTIERDGFKVPLGEGVETGVKQTSLLYNEFIVYDVAQIRFKYLVKLQYNYK